jgi:L-malate glycosyltransferase
LLPAALRPVKNVEFAISAIKPLWQVDKRFQLVIAGGEIDRSYTDGIRSMLAAAPWVSWLGEVPYEQMGALYRRADIVLNCSRYEGMPNSLMEAMALGRPVVAANILGNRSLVRHADTGWLFDSECTFRKLVTMLAGDEMMRLEVGRRARKSIEMNFSPCAEAEQYRDLYHKLA